MIRVELATVHSDSQIEPTWTNDQPGALLERPSSERCVFCEGPLVEAITLTGFRWVGAIRHRHHPTYEAVVTQRVPTSFCFLMCWACEIGFTMPLDSNHGG